ncbi:hypothetical protein E1200_04135 [Actinomadura sp. GC306]|uniref:hypothetical protein n=1 Tax=Actinomadura sp. GC306 TaxID=2530367 RepID=UPI0010465D1C|nr:hypothetical protein [Actinomadura sp. GC306]TDC70803.1 hypothetical protein E1200_04135 [Actinomadura sp. GC306]
MSRAEDERLKAIGQAAATVLRETDYHLARTEDIAAAVKVPAGDGDGRSRGGRRSAVWVYSEVRSRRVLVALALYEAWRAHLERHPVQSAPDRCTTLADARAALTDALLPIIRFHRTEARLVQQVGYGIGDIATTEKKRPPAAPEFADSPLGRVAAEAFAMRVAVFADHLAPRLRSVLESVTRPTAAEVADSARALSNLVFRTCLGDPDGPVDRIADALTAFWIERDLVRLAGTWTRDLDGAERSLATVRRRANDPRGECHSRAVLVRVLLEAGTLHRRAADEGALLVQRLQDLTGGKDGGDSTDLRALCDASSRLALARRAYGDLTGAVAAADLSLTVAKELGDASLAARAETGLGESYALLGRYDQADALLAAARDTRRRLVETAGETEVATARRRLRVTEHAIAFSLTRRGAGGTALLLINTLDAADRPPSPDLAAQEGMLHATALLEAGHPTAAREAAMAAYHLPHSGLASSGLRRALLVLLLAEASRQAGRPDAAVRLLAGAPVESPWFGERVSARCAVQGRMVHAAALLDRAGEGDAERALDLLTDLPALDPADPLHLDVHIRRAAAVHANGDSGAALGELDIVTGAAAPPLTMLRAALLCARIQRDTTAVADALTADFVDAEHPLVLTAKATLAEHRVAAGDLASAQALLEPFTDATPRDHGRTVLGVDHPLLHKAVSLLDRIGASHGWGELPDAIDLN